MPPKKGGTKKKVVKTQAELEKELEDWKNGEEYELLKTMNAKWEELKIGDKLNGTEDDLKFRVHPFLDEFQKIGAVFKIKNTKIKEVTQEHLRVAFFAGYQNRNQNYKIDGKEYMIEDNDINIDSNRVQYDFMAIRRLCADDLVDPSADSLQEKRKTLMDNYKDFVKYFKKFTKKGKAHAKAKEMMLAMLKPLQDLLQCNMGLSMVDFEYPEEINYEVNNFRYKALITTFCKCYMEVQKILYDNPKIDTEGVVKIKINGNPDIYSILKKFQYFGWRQNEVESYYIQPLMNAFMKWRSNMTKLYLLGFNYWFIPLIENIQMCEDINEMIVAEEESEFLLGNRLKREQLNFMYDQIKIIYISPGRERLFEKDKKKRKMINLSIPQLIILKSLERMYNVFQKKLNEKIEPEPYKRLEIDPPKPLIEFALMSSESDKLKTHQDLLPPGVANKEKMELANIGEIDIEIDDNSIPELDKYGRYFMWPDYLPDDQHQVMIDAAKLLRKINRAVLQDLEDHIIGQGMQATRTEIYGDKSANANLELLRLENEEKMNDVFRNRPPNIWNEPESLMNEHKFKASAKPLDVYKDDRVHDLYDRIKDLAETIATHNQTRWDTLVTGVIKVFERKFEKER